jgi:hypothetical protein
MTLPDDELLQLEQDGWQALATSGEDAAAFYGRILAPRILALLPGGVVIDDRETMISAMRGAPWDSYQIADARVVPLGSDAAVVAYRARARRGEDEYEAWFASTYVRDGQGWRLAVHQQTPS